MRTDNDMTKIGAEAPVHAALHCVKSLITNKYSKDHRSLEQWTGLLRSALAKIIDLAKTGTIPRMSTPSVRYIRERGVFAMPSSDTVNAIRRT